MDRITENKTIFKMIRDFQNLDLNYSPKIHYIHVHLLELPNRQLAASDRHDGQLAG